MIRADDAPADTAAAREAAPRCARFRPIKDYAIVGNTRSAALISSDGAIDWMCLPQFDSPSALAAILDPCRGGRLCVRLAGGRSTARRYTADTAVLETDLEGADGLVRITDFMPFEDGPDVPGSPLLCRRIEAIAGSPEIELTCDPRPGYAAAAPLLTPAGRHWTWSASGHSVTVRSDIRLIPVAGRTEVRGRLRLHLGHAVGLTFGASDRPDPGVPVLAMVEAMLEATQTRWRRWFSQLRYSGPYREVVARSALVLKLMTHGPSGAIIAAPTTSLPEHLGGVRNWDYRYCWLRDASMTMRALLEIGFPNEAQAFLRWLLHATRGDREVLRVLYRVDASCGVDESHLEYLEGYRGSRPVRIGNDAWQQRQLDLYGPVTDAAYLFARHGGRLTEKSAAMLRRLGDQVCEQWTSPDQGIWESRGPARHHTVSKAMCWVALDRLVRLNTETGLPVDAERYGRVAREIRADIDAHGWDPDSGTYTSTYEHKTVDASLLCLSLYGYEQARSERMRRTMARIDRELGPPPMLWRYHGREDGLPPGEGTFGLCSLWAVQSLALAGRVEEAEERFEQILSTASDLGLFAEQIDRDTGAALGNYPQAYTHIGVINAARRISEAAGLESRGESHDPRAEDQSV